MASRAPCSAMASRAPCSAMASRAPCSAMASRAPCSTWTSVCLFHSGDPVLCMYLCGSCGVSRVPTPPPRWNCYGSGRAFREGGVMLEFCRVRLVFPPPVSIFGSFHVIEFIWFQVCVCVIVNYLVYLSLVC